MLSVLSIVILLTHDSKRQIMIEIIKDKSAIAIVVVCYNRPTAAKRLLDSLNAAHYPSRNIPLIISVDCSGNEKMYELAQNFKWIYGPKYTVIHTKRLGLKKHIFECGDYTDLFKGIIILEDDLFVAQDFYNYTISAVDAYYNEDKVAGIALYADTINGYVGLPLYYWYDGADAFMMQSAITSGECFTDKMWGLFRTWYNTNKDVDPESYFMPRTIKNWRRAWSKYYNIYLVEKDLYFVHPHFSTTANCGEAGEHGNDINMLHSRMILGSKEWKFKSFVDSIKYDIYADFIGLGKYMGLDDKELCVDFYGDKNNEQKRRYWLSPYKLPYKIIDHFALKLEPMEANIVYNIKGNDLFLYDTSVSTNIKSSCKLTLHQFTYYFKNIDYRKIIRYVRLLVCTMAKTKISSTLKK